MSAIAYRCALALLVVIVLPSAVFAQASITGVVRDTSGAVLPGVTVEAASPILIEKVRSVVSDGTGQYRFVDLRPGTYTVTFTLPGFNTFKREGVDLAGNFTATINAELRVGSLEETITVTGESPVVDVQTVARQRVLDDETVEVIPTGRYFVNLGILIPGVSASCSAACQSGAAQDTGGASGDSSATLIAHGGRFRDQRISINNMTIRGATGYLGVTGPNIAAQQETQIDTSGADASVGTGGVRINVVPKDGGNRFAGDTFISGTNEHFQANNIDDDLRNRGLRGTTKVKRLYDVAPTFGGPIQQDKIWFFLAARRANNVNYAANVFVNANAYNPNLWTYEPDLTKGAVLGNPLPMYGARLTWQASERNKFAASFDYRDRCQCPNLSNGGNFGISPEAAVNFMFRPQHVAIATWTSPVTNRLLLDATVARLIEGWGNRPAELAAPMGTIRVIEQNPPDRYLGITTYRGSTGGNWTQYPYTDLGLNMTYVTGAHAFKTGVEFDWGYNDRTATPHLNGPITSIRVNSASGVPVPNQFTINAGPVRRIDRARADGGIYAQDRWTIRRLTLSGGLRLDFFSRYADEVTLGPSLVLPTRNITFPKFDIVSYKDVSPRMGAAYDVFGNGKTAVKASLNRYVQDLSLLANAGGSPAQNYQDNAVRSWTDSNRNFFPDCDWVDPRAQNLTATGGDICGAFTGTSANFGTSVPTSIDDPEIGHGWNHRGYNWEFSTSIQQEIVPRRVAIDVAYFRRWYGNFLVTDNFALEAADFGQFSVTVPNDARLPLSGQTISGFYDVNPNKASVLTDNHVRFSKHYGNQSEYWHGMDISSGIRLASGSQVQGGVSFGRQITDNCEVIAKVPEASTQGVSLTGAPLTIAGPLAAPFCHQAQPWLTQVKGLAAYTIPRIDVQVAGTFQSVPGPQIAANFVVPNAAIRPSLGRDLSGGAANATVRIIEPGSIYGDRLFQMDFRAGKIIRLGAARRLTASVDLYNLLNGNSVLQQNDTYSLTSSIWSTPQLVQQARLLKFTLTMNF